MNDENGIGKLHHNWLLIIGMICVAATLRAPLTAVGPVINEIKDGLHIDNGLAGFLTTIPLLIFGIVSPFVARIVERFSMSRAILYAVILLTLGLLLRVSGGIELFIIGTIIIGIAIAFGNVTLPSYVKWMFPLQIGIVTGIYSATMNFTAGLGGGLSYPLSDISPLGFRMSLGFWIAFALIAIIVWLPQVKNKRQEQSEELTDSAAAKPKYKVSRSRLAWATAMTMGFQSMIFYTTVAWVPSILMHLGMDPLKAGYYLMLNQFAQVPMTFLFPIIASRMSNQRILIVIISILYFVGFGLLIVGGPWIILAMIISGLAAGASFSICMTIFTLRARTSEGSIALSGFGQSVGYLIAAIGPFFIGYLHDATHSWTSCIIAILVMCLMFMLFGLKATVDRVVEDDVA